MDFRNMKYSKNIHDKLKKCEFCGKELIPIGLDFLYANISSEDIKYEKCNCIKSKEYWKELDKKEYENNKKNHFREVINTIYKQNYIGRKFQEMNFENYIINENNQEMLKVINDYINKYLMEKQTKGLIITGESGVGKTHLAAAIANSLIENEKIVLMGRLITLLDIIKETFRDNTKSENELIELYSECVKLSV